LLSCPTRRSSDLSHWPKVSGSFKDSLGVVASELEARTDGRFKLEPLGAGEIAKGGEIYNIVRRGVVAMGTISPAYNLGESELMSQYMGVPGTFRDPWEMMHMTKNLGLEAALNEQLKSKGVFYMADKAYPTELVLKNGIKKGDDLGGIKVRSAGAMLEYLQAAGFAPQQVAGPEIYQAISTGVVDGAHWGAAIGALSMKFWEVATFHMKPALLIANDAYIINLDAYNKLPDDLRLIFTSLVENRYYQRSVEYQHQEAISLNTGVSKMDVTVQRYPDDVLSRLQKASATLVEKEAAKGPKAKEMVDKLNGLMKDLGYV